MCVIYAFHVYTLKIMTYYIINLIHEKIGKMHQIIKNIGLYICNNYKIN